MLSVDVIIMSSYASTPPGVSSRTTVPRLQTTEILGAAHTRGFPARLPGARGDPYLARSHRCAGAFVLVYPCDCGMPLPFVALTIARTGPDKQVIARHSLTIRPWRELDVTVLFRFAVRLSGSQSTFGSTGL